MDNGENVSLNRWAVNFMQMVCARGLLLNCRPCLTYRRREQIFSSCRLDIDSTETEVIEARLRCGKCARNERNDKNTKHSFIVSFKTKKGNNSKKKFKASSKSRTPV